MTFDKNCKITINYHFIGAGIAKRRISASTVMVEIVVAAEQKQAIPVVVAWVDIDSELFVSFRLTLMEQLAGILPFSSTLTRLTRQRQEAQLLQQLLLPLKLLGSPLRR